MSSTSSMSRLAKAKNLLAQFDSKQLTSQNFTQITITLKGLKFIEDPETGLKPSLLDIKLAQLQNAFFASSQNPDQSVSVSILMRNNATILQIYTFVRNKLKQKFKNNNFENQALQLYCKGKLIAGNQNLMTIKEIVKKYQTTEFICERTEVFG